MVDTVPDMLGLGISDAEGLECGEDGHIQFEGLPNTRDLGGMKTVDGRVIKHGLLLRSGMLGSATERDLKVLLDTYHVKTVVDLRTEEERLASPDPEDALMGVCFEHAPLLNNETFGVTRQKGLRGALKMLRAVQKNPAKVMMDIYPQMLLDEESQKGLIAFFHAVLAARDGSILWHCSIGKDRVGLATALLLHALGVSYDDVMADYRATNRYVGSRMEEISATLEAYKVPGKLDDSIHVINSADPRFLNAALDAVVQQYGSLDAYLEDALGVTRHDCTTLQQRYLVGGDPA